MSTQSPNRLPLRARLIIGYLVILATGGVVISLVGSWIVSSAIMSEAQARAVRNLATARTIYGDELDGIRRTVSLLAGEPEVAELAARGSVEGEHRLRRVFEESGFDFMGVTDERGQTVLRAAPGASGGDSASGSAVIRAALEGRAAAATELLGAEVLAREAPGLEALAALDVVPTERGWRSEPGRLTPGMVLLSAAPLRNEGGVLEGAVYAGVLLNRNLDIVDRVWRVLYSGDTYLGEPVGTVTIFLDGVRIATTVRNPNGERALGTTVSEEVGRAVLGQGQPWEARAFVVHDWYLSAYEPIRDLDGRIIGIL